jgi:Flp pilus assembly protein TadD
MTDSHRQAAQAMFGEGDYGAAHRSAVQGLRDAPDDVELLLLAGRAGSEIDAEDALGHLRRATELAPDDARTWSALGEGLITEGSTVDADAAFRRAVELDPDDRVALTHLGHTSMAVGRDQEGVGYLARAADALGGASTASVSLIDMYRSFGQDEQALEQARRLAEAAPGDIVARLDVAELSLAVGNLDQAREAFDALRDLDDVPGHEAYPLHGLIRVEIAQEHWDQALELATQARTIDPHGLGADVEAFLQAQTGAAADAEPDADPPPSREQVEAALDASLVEYRRMNADDRRANAGQILG